MTDVWVWFAVCALVGLGAIGLALASLDYPPRVGELLYRGQFEGMTDHERARQCAILFNHYGASWRYNVPIDLRVIGEPGSEVVEFGDGITLRRGADNRWAVTYG